MCRLQMPDKLGKSTRIILTRLKNVQEIKSILQQSGAYQLVPHSDELEVKMEKQNIQKIT